MVHREVFKLIPRCFNLMDAHAAIIKKSLRLINQRQQCIVF